MGKVFLVIAIVAIFFTLLAHMAIIIEKIGLPSDVDLLEITIRTEGSSSATVYGTAFDYRQDEFGNNLVIVTNCYEARFVHWGYSPRRSFYAGLIGARHVNDMYYVPEK